MRPNLQDVTPPVNQVCVRPAGERLTDASRLKAIWGVRLGVVGDCGAGTGAWAGAGAGHGRRAGPRKTGHEWTRSGSRDR
jgi:hypothetical protein